MAFTEQPDLVHRCGGMPFDQNQVIMGAEPTEEKRKPVGIMPPEKKFLAEQGHIGTGLKKTITVLARGINDNTMGPMLDHDHPQAKLDKFRDQGLKQGGLAGSAAAAEADDR